MKSRGKPVEKSWTIFFRKLGEPARRKGREVDPVINPPRFTSQKKKEQ